MSIRITAGAGLALVVSIAALAGSASPASAASFDCAKARTPDEIAICADPALSRADEAIAAAFAKAKAVSRDDALAIARTFIGERGACRDDRACLLARSLAVLLEYRNFDSTIVLPPGLDAAAIADGTAPASPDLPRAVGECVSTTVLAITPRLDSGAAPTDADFDSGTAVEFANQGHQVSYDREPALLASRRGDAVTLCLIAIPRDCPPGDERGRVYAGTNRRTKGSWALPDSQHSCGGA